MDTVIAHNIKRLRKEKNLTCSELAAKANNMGRSTLQDIESGDTSHPGVWTMHRLAKALGVTIEEFLTLKDQDNAKPSTD